MPDKSEQALLEVGFTKGPWGYKSASRASRNILDIEGDGRLLAFTAATCNESEANARLIAAAPDLYAALSELACVFVNTTFPGDHPVWAAFAKAEAALAKARGQ